MKMLTDMHTHTTFSHDGVDTPAIMLSEALKRNIAFYGVSEHFDYDYDQSIMTEEVRQETKNGDEDAYFHELRHLQEDYEGMMNVAVGAEFGYCENPAVQQRYMETYEKYRPDFIINSVHSTYGVDFSRTDLSRMSKEEIYKRY